VVSQLPEIMQCHKIRQNQECSTHYGGIMCIHLNFAHYKATQALNYFALKSRGRISTLKALKLTYFADRFHLRKYGRPITNDEYFAMRLGPVPCGVKDIAEISGVLDQQYREYILTFISRDGDDVESVNSVDRNVLSESDMEALSFAWETFGKLDQHDLSEMTHQYPEWKKHESALKICPRIRMDLYDFFDDPETDTDKCYDLTENDRTERQEQLKERAAIEALWS